MKILFLSGCAPAKYNYREPNAYPFYLIKEIASRHETGVLYFNNNKKVPVADIDADLGKAGVTWQKEIRPHRLMKLFFLLWYIPRGLLMKLAIYFKIRPPRFIVPLQLSVYNKYPDDSFDEYIKQFAPDLVIIFPMQLFFCVKKITKLGIPVSLLCTDSTALHFSRQLAVTDRIGVSSRITRQMLEQSIKLETAYKKIRASYFFVGKDDKESFIKNSRQKNNSFFIPHHLYSGVHGERKWDITDNQVNVLFGGDGHTIYVGDEVDMIAKQIAQSNQLDPRKINFYFLGVHYDKAIGTLQKAGYTVISQAWAEDYDEYIKKVHVQVFPIILGTGTKAKVLAAMVSGLLCAGTKYAFENICATPSDYLLYDSPAEIPGLLAAVCDNIPYYEQIAITTREKILVEQSTARVVDMILAGSQNKVTIRI